MFEWRPVSHHLKKWNPLAECREREDQRHAIVAYWIRNTRVDSLLSEHFSHYNLICNGGDVKQVTFEQV